MTKQKKLISGKDDSVLVNDAVAILKVSERQMEIWLKEKRFPVHKNASGMLAIAKADFSFFAQSEEAKKGALATLLYIAHRRGQDENSGRAVVYCKSMEEQLVRCRGYIKAIEVIHSQYHKRVDVLHDESPVVAAYVLYAKVIRLLNMACLCLEHHYWETLTLLRLIDEAIQLAEYFFLSETNPDIAHQLRVWFRENHSPKNATVRKALSTKAVWQHLNEVNVTKDQPLSRPLIDIMEELHNKKSKELHHTYNGMWQIHRVKGSGDKVVHEGFYYGPCEHSGELRSGLANSDSPISDSLAQPKP